MASKPLSASHRTAGNFFGRALYAAWNLCRYPLASILVLLEPLVTGILATLAVLGMGTALLVSAALPSVAAMHLTVLWVGSALCFVAIFVYVGLIALLHHD